MIKVNVFFDEKKMFDSINITGHANSKKNDQEYDLICGSVSSIVFGILNKLHMDNFIGELLVEENLIIIKLSDLDKDNLQFRVVLETMLIQLETIQESYPKNIKINKINNKGDNNV